jgi:hypothetical protein
MSEVGTHVPSPVRLSLTVTDEVYLGVEPLGALDAVMLAQTGQVLGRVAVLVLGEVLGREQVGLDLVDVPDMGVNRLCTFDEDRDGRAYLVCRRVLVRVFLFLIPILAGCRVSTCFWYDCSNC